MQIIPYHKSFRNGGERLIISLKTKCRPSRRFCFDILSYSSDENRFEKRFLNNWIISFTFRSLYSIVFFLIVSLPLICWINHRQACKSYSVEVIVVVVRVVVSISIYSRVCDFTLENDCRRRRRLDYKRSIDLFCSCYFSGSSHIYFHDLSNVISAMKLIASHQLFAVEPKDKWTS